MPDPWEDIRNRYDPGDVIECCILKICAFGAFAEIEPGVAGLILIPEITSERIAHPREKFVVGQRVRAEILLLNESGRCMALSTKQLEN